jgi:hypothetical protein
MKKGIISAAVLLLFIFAGAFGFFQSDRPVDREPAEGPASPIVLEEGAVCKPYNPEGDVVYDSEWTGVFPEIEKYDKDYATATFGMG